LADDKPSLELARELQQQGKLDRAASTFAAVLARDPDNQDAARGLANAAELLGQWTRAVEAYERLASLRPGDPDVQTARAECLRQAGCFTAAIDAYEASLQLADDQLYALAGRGECLRMLGRPDDALGWFERALQVDDGHPFAVRGRAACLNALWRFEEAVPVWEQALALSPGSTFAEEGLREARQRVARAEDRSWKPAEPPVEPSDPRLDWARALRAEGRLAEAVGVLEGLTASAPDDVGWQVELARALSQADELDAARQAWERVLRLDPTHAEAAAEVGHCRRRSRRYVQALGAYDRALELDAGRIDALYGRAETLRLLGRWVDAVGWYRRTIESAPAHVDAMVGLAHTLEALDKHHEAEPLLRKALALQPDRGDLAQALRDNQKAVRAQQEEGRQSRARAAFERGRQRMKDGRAADAVDAIREAVRVDASYVAAHYLLGLCLVEVRAFDNAVDAFEAVLRHDPDHLDAAWRRADVLRRGGKLVAALEAYDAVLARDPDDPRCTAGRGDVLRQMGRLEASLRWFDRSLASRPRNVLALSGKAAALNGLSRYEEAHGLWLQALQEAPNHQAIKRGLAACRAGMAANGHPDPRTEGSQLPVPAAPTALSVRRTRSRAREDFYRGRRLYKQRRFAEAAAAFRRVLEIEPVHAEAALRLGMALEDDGSFEQAIRAYRLCLSIDPSHCQAATNIGEALRKGEKYPEAIAAYDHALELRSDYLYALAGRAECMRMVGNLEGAIQWFDRALEVGPRHAFAVQGKAAALNALRRFDEAMPLWERALEIEPSSSFAAEGKAVCARHLSPDEDSTSETPNLDEQGRDLTQLASEGELSPVIGREQEIRQVMKTLVRRLKANPLLLGDPGVGKTAVVEGVAQRLASNDVPARLRGLRIVELSMGSLIAGTKYRGTFEERLRDLVNEAKKTPDLVLFIDEIHTLVGAGRTEGGALDAANILKPALARGEITVIGATTVDEYRKHFEADSALDRRFQPIRVDEPSEAETLQLLGEVVELYEAHHEVGVQRSALSTCVRMAVRFIPERRLPDKALDLLDEACADASLDGAATVDAERVAVVVSERTGVPVHTLTAEERARLDDLPRALAERVVGQDAAIGELVRAVRVARSGLRSPSRPRGVFLFAGGSGVGKTELARALSDQLFPEGDALIKLDMSEYADRFTGSRLLGAPPGYQGHGEEGQLTGPLRERPYAVVLLDEFEKAHTDVQAMFLSLFDEGVVTDAEGRRVQAREAFFILTTNAGSTDGARKGLGFGGDRGRGAALERVKRHFRPELYNRLDGVVVFEPLTEAGLQAVVRLHLSHLAERAGEQGVQLTWSDGVVAACAGHEADPKLGARPALRAIDELVAEPLGQRLLAPECPTVLHARWLHGEVVFDALQQTRRAGQGPGHAPQLESDPEVDPMHEGPGDEPVA